MEESVILSAIQKKDAPEEARQMNPLTLAWIGDAVFSDYVRHYLVALGNVNVNHLTKKSVDYVCAEAQAEMLRHIQPLLTDAERDIVRRGRNTRSTPPKHADKMDYRYATGLEALFGYLSLIGDDARSIELMTKCIMAVEKQ